MSDMRGDMQKKLAGTHHLEAHKMKHGTRFSIGMPLDGGLKKGIKDTIMRDRDQPGGFRLKKKALLRSLTDNR
jgi:hypothetical protein